MEIVLYTRPVINGDFVFDCGFKCDMKGSAYFRSEDSDAFHVWFRKHLYPQGWTLTCGGPANPHSPELDSKGERLDKVYSMKRHYKKERGRQGTLGECTKTIIYLNEGVDISV